MRPSRQRGVRGAVGEAVPLAISDGLVLHDGVGDVPDHWSGSHAVYPCVFADESGSAVFAYHVLDGLICPSVCRIAEEELVAAF